jgi:hypothetical protein
MSSQSSLFLISTTNDLLLLDLQADRLYQVDSGNGLYYGICHHAGAVYALCRHSVRGPEDPAVRSAENGSLLVFDSRLQLQEELQPEFPMRDVHGMAVIDEQLWITCSYDNLIAIFDLRTKRWSQWYPSPNPEARGKDVNHFNTIAMLDGRLCVVAHNFGQSQLFFYEYPSRQLTSSVALGSEAHDVFQINARLATCDSAHGTLISIDGSQIRTGGFPRGVCITEKEILVGISMTIQRSQRHLMSAILRRYTKEWAFQADYVLEEAGMILAVQQLPEFDPSHLPPWPHVKKFCDSYNDLDPGNIYRPGHSDANLILSDWHEMEGEGRWTAAKNAHMTVLRNPGEDCLTVEAVSSYPGAFPVEIWINEILLGIMDFQQPGLLKQTFMFSMGPCRPASLSFLAPKLWRPKDVIHENKDERVLGVFVVSVAAAPSQGSDA